MAFGETSKRRILFLMQLPPPVHGSSLLCDYIRQSSRLNNLFECEFLDVSTETNLITIGKFSVTKVTRTLRKIYECVSRFRKFKPHRVYIAITPTGLAFARDSLVVLLLKALGATLVFQLHCKGLKHATRTPLRRWYYRIVFKGCDVIQSDPLLHPDIENCFDTSQKIFFVPNGCPDFGPSPKRRPKQAPVEILYLSNFIRSKGAHVLLEALRLVSLRYPDKFRATLVGGITDQQYFDELRDQAAKFPVANIDVVGPLYEAEKNSAFANSDIFVLPTAYPNECYPVSILEAWSHNLAVLSTYEGAISSMIEVGKNGYQFNPENPQELADQIITYIENPKKLNEHQRYARETYERNFTVAHFQERTISVLASILEPQKTTSTP